MKILSKDWLWVLISLLFVLISVNFFPGITKNAMVGIFIYLAGVAPIFWLMKRTENAAHTENSQADVFASLSREERRALKKLMHQERKKNPDISDADVLAIVLKKRGYTSDRVDIFRV